MDYSQRLLEHGDFIQALARSLVRDAHRADDVAQETMRIALERPPRHEGNLRGWLGRVVRNVAALGNRRDSRRRQREARVARPEATASTAAIVARLDWETRLVRAVRELDEPYRATIVLRFFEQLSPGEIARRMDVPRKTVYTRLQRALDRLRSRLDAETGGDRRTWCAALALLSRPSRSGGAVAAAAVAATILVGVVGTSLAWTARDGSRASRSTPTAQSAPAVATGLAEPASETEPRSTRPDADEALRWARRLDTLPDDYMLIMPEAVRLVDADPDLLPRVFASMRGSFAKRQVLKLLGVRRNHPRSLEVYRLAARDEDAAVRQHALDEVLRLVVEPMTPDTALAWLDRHRHDELRPLVVAQVPEAIAAIRAHRLDPYRSVHGAAVLSLDKELRAAGLTEVLDDRIDAAGPGDRYWLRLWRDRLPETLSGAPRPPSPARPPQVPPELWNRLHPHPGINRSIEITAGWAERPDALDYVRRLWPHLDAYWRSRTMITFTGERAHPDTIRFLALGVRDANDSVSENALEMLEEVVFRRIAGRAGFERWASTWEDQPYAEVRRHHARRFVETLTPRTLAAIDSFRGAVDLLKAAGILDEVAKWTQPPFRRVELLRPNAAFVRRTVLPHLRPGTRELAAVCRIVGRTKTPWARDALLDALSFGPKEAAGGLAELGDIAVLGHLVDALADGKPVEEALAKLAGVPPGDWGVDWWRRYLARRR